MKATYTTSDPIEQARIIKATDMAICIFEISSNLRKQIQRDIEATPVDDPYNVLDTVFDRIEQILHNNGVVIDDLIE